VRDKTSELRRWARENYGAIRRAPRETRAQLAWDADACAFQRDDLRARLDRIRAAAISDIDLERLPAFRDFLLRETEPGWLYVPKRDA